MGLGPRPSLSSTSPTAATVMNQQTCTSGPPLKPLKGFAQSQDEIPTQSLPESGFYLLFQLSLPFCSELSALTYFYFFPFFGHASQPVDSSAPRPGVEPTPPASAAWSLNHWTASEVPELPAVKPTSPALSKLGPARATLSAQSTFPLCPACRVAAPWLSCRQTHPGVVVGLSAHQRWWGAVPRPVALAERSFLQH